MADPRRFDWLFRPRVRDEDAPLSAESRFSEALAQLPADERSALALSELGGLEPAEIAQRLGTDREAAERLVARARETVRTALAERGRRLLGALLPFQSPWSSGVGAAVRTFGAVAVGTVGIGATFDGARVLPAATAAPGTAKEAATAEVRSAAPVLTRERRTAPAPRMGLTTLATGQAATRHRPERQPIAGSIPLAPAPDAAPDPAAAAESAGQVDRTPRLGLVRVVAVTRRQIRPDHVHGTVLHLPDVAQLVRDEVVGRVGAAKQDRAHERVAVVAAEAGQLEEPGRVDDTDAVDPDLSGIERERVEPRLRADEPPVRASASAPTVG